MGVPKPISLLFPMFIAFFLLLVSSKVDAAASAVAFNFPNFKSGSSSLTFQGDARILATGVLQLTHHNGLSTGRVLYTTPIPLWDSATGNVASFVSSFSFVVADIRGNFNKADGIVFFIAPEDTQIPNGSTGGCLGVNNPDSSLNRFVGVEFDSFTNVGVDPNYPHIGIDVLSLVSLKTVRWDRVSGSLVRATVIYDSLSKTLSVAVTNANGRITTVSQVVDLKYVLPQRVRVGFSATTTNGGRQTHDLHSWSFTSSLETTIITPTSANTTLVDDEVNMINNILKA